MGRAGGATQHRGSCRAMGGAPQLFRPSSVRPRRAGTGVTLHTDQANGLLRLATVALSLHRQGEIEADLRELRRVMESPALRACSPAKIGGVEGGWRWAMSRGSPRMERPRRVAPAGP